jgi:hypothetical protein
MELNILEVLLKGSEGEWRERSRKHRYLMVFDKELKRKIDVEGRRSGKIILVILNQNPFRVT